MKYYLCYDFGLIQRVQVEKSVFDSVIDAWSCITTIYRVDTVHNVFYNIIDKYGAKRTIGCYSS